MSVYPLKRAWGPLGDVDGLAVPLVLKEQPHLIVRDDLERAGVVVAPPGHPYLGDSPSSLLALRGAPGSASASSNCSTRGPGQPGWHWTVGHPVG